MDNKLKSVNNENLLLILEEFAKTQKLQAISINDLTVEINFLSGKFDIYSEELKKQKQSSVTVNTYPMQDLIRKCQLP